MKILKLKQGTPEWVNARLSIPTASEFKRLFTDSLEPRKGQMPKSYLDFKLAELWDGPQLSGSSKDMERGNILEEEARPSYAISADVDIDTPGFILSDDGRLGCSPDGMVGALQAYGDENPDFQLYLPNDTAYGLEIKCLNAENHIGCVREGGLPCEFAAQVHGSMLVTGLSSWVFYSYHRSLPDLTIRVQRHEPTMRIMRERLDEFNAQLDREHAKLCEANGGPPARLIAQGGDK